MKVTEYKLLDSSAWLALFHEENLKVRDIVEDKIILFTSALSIFEIKKRLIRLNLKEERVNEILDFVRKRSIIIELTDELAEKAVLVSTKYKLGAIDSLIYATASAVNALLVSGDKDFNGLPNTEIIS